MTALMEDRRRSKGKRDSDKCPLWGWGGGQGRCLASILPFRLYILFLSRSTQVTLLCKQPSLTELLLLQVCLNSSFLLMIETEYHWPRSAGTVVVCFLGLDPNNPAQVSSLQTCM